MRRPFCDNVKLHISLETARNEFFSNMDVSIRTFSMKGASLVQSTAVIADTLGGKIWCP